MHKHTKLLNLIIGFTKTQKNWPKLLDKFDVVFIDHSLKITDNKKSVPDLFLMNKYSNTVLFCECKSGNNFTKDCVDQLNRYFAIKQKDFIHYIHTCDSEHLEFETFYATYTENSKLIKELNLIKKVPIILFDEDWIIKENEFCINKHKHILKSKFKIEGLPDLNYIPFFKEDELKDIVIPVLQKIVYLYTRKKEIHEIFSEELILKEIFGNLYSSLDSTAKLDLKNKVKSIIDTSNSKFKLKEKIVDIKSKKMYSTNTFQSIQRLCDDIVKHYRDCKDQRQIYEYL